MTYNVQYAIYGGDGLYIIYSTVHASIEKQIINYDLFKAYTLYNLFFTFLLSAIMDFFTAICLWNVSVNYVECEWIT